MHVQYVKFFISLLSSTAIGFNLENMKTQKWKNPSIAVIFHSNGMETNYILRCVKKDCEPIFAIMAIIFSL